MSTVESEVEPEFEPEIESEVETEVESEVEPEVESEVEPEVESEVKPEVFKQGTLKYELNELNRQSYGWQLLRMTMICFTFFRQLCS